MRPKPWRVRALRNCFGTIWSVSTLTRSSGATMPVCVENGCIRELLLKTKTKGQIKVKLLGLKTRSFDGNHVEFAHIHKMSRNRGGGGHHRADQMRTAVFALAAFKIAIRGAGAALVRRKNVGVHADAH